MPKPILRWAGGKNWLAQRIDSLFQIPDYHNYYEPFLGGGSIFFSLCPQNGVYLSDLNADLIETYLAVRDFPDDVINVLQDYENSEEFYYLIRNTEPDLPAERAARFIYLNQTSFNGIYRVNRQGRYNVLYGYRTKNFLEKDNLIKVSRRLQNANIFVGDFDSIRETLTPRDLVFLDPPYTVSQRSGENGFIKYNSKLFSLEDQYRLRSLIDFIDELGAYYILTNAAHEVIREIFAHEHNQMIEIQRASLISGQNAQRGQITEFIFTNI